MPNDGPSRMVSGEDGADEHVVVVWMSTARQVRKVHCAKGENERDYSPWAGLVDTVDDNDGDGQSDTSGDGSEWAWS